MLPSCVSLYQGRARSSRPALREDADVAYPLDSRRVPVPLDARSGSVVIGHRGTLRDALGAKQA